MQKNRYLLMSASLVILGAVYSLRNTDFTAQVGGTCGDDILDAGEACDDGNTNAGDGCDASCAIEPSCRCYAVLGEPSSCACCATCSCGNGIMEVLEECDDGNSTDGDGCTSVCVIEDGYQCPRNTWGTQIGRSTCSMVGSCGNLVLEPDLGEECEPDFTATTTFSENGFAACGSTCTVMPGYLCFDPPGLSLSFCYADGQPMCSWTPITEENIE